MLTLKDIHIGYGKIEVIKGVSLSVNKGELDVIIGSNGAGKTTILKTISGLLKPISGEIMFKNRNISNIPTENRVKLGITMCPQGSWVFPYHTVYQNLLLGGYLIKKNKEKFRDRINEMYKIFPILKERSNQLAGSLSGGEQQMLAIARSLMIEPDLLLLDEPSAGLAPKYVAKIFELISHLAKSKITTILLVEQLAKKALKIADRAYVLETGKIMMEGTGEELLDNDKVIKSYLGS